MRDSEKCKISIIIATYNSENTIEQALYSVLYQDFDSWECIVIDGKSSDNTIKIVQNFARKDSRFRYITEPDNGIYDALNKGIRISNGTWIYILGSDDTLLNNGLSLLIQHGDNECADVVCANIKTKCGDNITGNFIHKDVKRVVWDMPCSHQGMIMRRNIIKELNGFNLSYSICADFDLTQRAYLKGYKFVTLNHFVALFDIGGSSNNYYLKTSKEKCLIIRNNKSVSWSRLMTCYIMVRAYARKLKKILP